MILTSNSGTTFLRIGGDNRIKIKSNLAWKFKLLPLGDNNNDGVINADDMPGVGIWSAETEDEIEWILSGTGSTFENINWINIVDDLGDVYKEITGKGTTYLTIRADENFTGKDLFGVGYAEAISEPNICDFTVFEQYGKNYYVATFKNVESPSETDTESKVYTPGEIEPTSTTIPVELYTTTKCKVTITGFNGINGDTGEEFVVGTGVTRTGYPDEEFVFEFHVPENKTAENIIYTLRATSEEDNTFSVPYPVIHKGVTPEVILTINGAESSAITYDTTAFTINYQIKPLSLNIDLGIFKDDTLVDIKHISNSSTYSEDGYYRGAFTYECGENPNQGSGDIVYKVSGETLGETFSATSNVVTVTQEPEPFYFELICNGQTGQTIDNVNTLDIGLFDANGGPLTVSVHTNLSNIESINKPSFISIGTSSHTGDYFTVPFTVESNTGTTTRNAEISFIDNMRRYGKLTFTQNSGGSPGPGPTPTQDFYFNDSRLSSGNMTTAGTLSLSSADAASYLSNDGISFTSTYSSLPTPTVDSQYSSDVTNISINNNKLCFNVSQNTDTDTRDMTISIGNIGRLTISQPGVTPQKQWNLKVTTKIRLSDGRSAKVENVEISCSNGIFNTFNNNTAYATYTIESRYIEQDFTVCDVSLNQYINQYIRDLTCTISWHYTDVPETTLTSVKVYGDVQITDSSPLNPVVEDVQCNITLND